MDTPTHRERRQRNPGPGSLWLGGLSLACLLLGSGGLGAARAAVVRGEVVDADTRKPIPSRVYLQGEDGRWHFAQATAAGGSAVRYEKRNWVNTNAVEMHVTLSAHPFELDLPPGQYTVTVERGKEYAAQARKFTVADAPVALRFELRRWINMAERGWYSGDTHVHRSLEELPNLMLAEDLNVAFPLTYWVTKSGTPPSQGDKNTAASTVPQWVRVDDTHALWPLNTEYEIFTVEGRAHTLGAVFALRHQAVLEVGLPPVGPVAVQARQAGALLDLDKHDWPWSMALVPLMKIDLFELANNHIWRTEFAFTNWSSRAAAFMNLPNEGGGGTEVDWMNYGFQNYYALLECGFRLRPTAGTANGVHPVPLGFGRVYVHLDKGFDPAAWVQGLDAGRSFVTTGPMLLATVNKELPGHSFRQGPKPQTYKVAGTALNQFPLDRIEIVVNGDVAAVISPRNKLELEKRFESRFEESLRLDQSAWLAVRCFERVASGKTRFAHTAPFHVEVEGQPLPPRKEAAAFLVKRVEDEIARSKPVLAPAALAEYEKALEVYRQKLAEAR